jgi:hypothetical protein
MLKLAAVLLFLTGIAHSYLGERYILIRLFKRDNLPRLLGGTSFTVGTLRFAWHLTTVAWWALACLIWMSSTGEVSTAQMLHIIAWAALISGCFPLLFTRGRHLSWLVFFAVAALLFAAY